MPEANETEKSYYVLRDEKGTFFKISISQLEELKMRDDEVEQFLGQMGGTSHQTPATRSELGEATASQFDRIAPSQFVRVAPSHFVRAVPSQYVRAVPSHFVRAVPSQFVPAVPSHLVRVVPSHFVRAVPSQLARVGPHLVGAFPPQLARDPHGSEIRGSGPILHSWHWKPNQP